MHVLAFLCVGVLLVSLSNAAIPAGYKGTPFCCDSLQGHYQQIPGHIECVFFDGGGDGVAFHYPGGCGSGGTTMRKTLSGQAIAADAPLCMQPFSGYDYIFKSNPSQHETGYWHLAWIDSAGQIKTDTAGEWLKYSVHVNTAGMYYVSFHQANAYLPNLEQLSFYNGQNVKIDSIRNMPVDTPIPSGCIEVWHSWTTSRVDSVVLDTGLQVVELAFRVGSWNIDRIAFDLHKATPVLHQGFQEIPGPDEFSVRPVENALAVSMRLRKAGRATFAVLDCRGRVVGSPVSRSVTSGAQSQTLPMGRLTPGIYFMQMEFGGIISQSRFLVTR